MAGDVSFRMPPPAPTVASDAPVVLKQTSRDRQLVLTLSTAPARCPRRRSAMKLQSVICMAEPFSLWIAPPAKPAAFCVNVQFEIRVPVPTDVTRAPPQPVLEFERELTIADGRGATDDAHAAAVRVGARSGPPVIVNPSMVALAVTLKQWPAFPPPFTDVGISRRVPRVVHAAVAAVDAHRLGDRDRLGHRIGARLDVDLGAARHLRVVDRRLDRLVGRRPALTVVTGAVESHVANYGRPGPRRRAARLRRSRSSDSPSCYSSLPPAGFRPPTRRTVFGNPLRFCHSREVRRVPRKNVPPSARIQQITYTPYLHS